MPSLISAVGEGLAALAESSPRGYLPVCSPLIHGTLSDHLLRQAPSFRLSTLMVGMIYPQPLPIPASGSTLHLSLPTAQTTERLRWGHVSWFLSPLTRLQPCGESWFSPTWELCNSFFHRHPHCQTAHCPNQSCAVRIRCFVLHRMAAFPLKNRRLNPRQWFSSAFA